MSVLEEHVQQKNELTGKPTLMKELNIGLITDALEKYREATRVELSAITQISQPTVNALISQMLKEKIVVSVGMAESTGGRKAEVFALNHKRYRIASVIVKENCFEYMVTDLELNMETSGKIDRDGRQSFLEQLCQIVGEVREEYRHIRAVAVGVPGAVSEKGEIFAIPMIPEWEGFNLKQALEQEFPISVVVMNDINAVAVGYFHYCQDETQNMVYLHVGSDGIGAGLIIDGRLYSGFKSFAGEVGYMQLGEDLLRAEHKLGAIDQMAHRTAFLEKMVTNIICVLNPEKIVIGGGDIQADFENIRQGCLKYLPEEVMPQFVMIPCESVRSISDTGYYFNGLGKMGKELLDKNIRLA